MFLLRNALFSQESKIALYLSATLGVVALPQITKKWVAPIFILIILTVTTIATFAGKTETDRTNSELTKKLQSTSQELEALKKNYADLSNILGMSSNGGLSLPIRTRLGIKLTEGGRYSNFLWVTGEVENIANITLYNVRLRFTLHTTNNTDVSEDIIGTMQPHQIVTTRYTAYTSLGAIASWNLEPVATYEP
jgi:hypothetical protein